VHCDVTKWESQTKLFEHAIGTFGSVDIVVANAGIYETGIFLPLDDDDAPSAPNLKTLEVNTNGVIYTTRLAVHYLRKSNSDLKAVILLGSMASWIGAPSLQIYAASKHAVLGLMRGIDPTLRQYGIRTATIHPWYADTNILPISAKILLAGVPLASVPRVAGAILCSATDPDMETSGSAWTLLDHGPVMRLEKEILKEGVYGIMDARNKRIAGSISGIRLTLATTRDLLKIVYKANISKMLCILPIAMVLFRADTRRFLSGWWIEARNAIGRI